MSKFGSSFTVNATHVATGPIVYINVRAITRCFYHLYNIIVAAVCASVCTTTFRPFRKDI